MYNEAHQIDRHIYPYIAGLLFEDYRYLVPTTRAKLRQRFLDRNVEEPRFTYRRLKQIGFKDKRCKIDLLQSEINKCTDPLVAEVYSYKVLEIENRINLLEASKIGNDRGFVAASVKLYGAPRKDIFSYTLSRVKKKVDFVKDHFTDVRIRDVLLPLERVCQNAVNQKFDWSAVIFQKILSDDDGGKVLGSMEIQDLCLRELASLNINNWHVRISKATGSTVFDTDHESRTIFIPCDQDLRSRKTPLTEPYVRALIAHEIGTHVARRVNGERSRLRLLGMGFDNYLRGEEGIATYNADMVLGTDDFAGEARYLAVSLGYGLDGQPRSFRSLWEILKGYFAVKLLFQNKDSEKNEAVERALTLAPTHAWLSCLRTFRGSTGGTPGAVFTKDVAYREGSIVAWNLVSQNSHWQECFSIGKYDPSNERHCRILRSLGYLDLPKYSKVL